MTVLIDLGLLIKRIMKIWKFLRNNVELKTEIENKVRKHYGFKIDEPKKEEVKKEK